jgi:hypothetical protein
MAGLAEFYSNSGAEMEFPKNPGVISKNLGIYLEIRFGFVSEKLMDSEMNCAPRGLGISSWSIVEM